MLQLLEAIYMHHVRCRATLWGNTTTIPTLQRRKLRHREITGYVRPDLCSSQHTAEPGFAPRHSNSSACALNISVIVLLSPLWTINIHSFPMQWVISISCSCVSDMSHLWSEKAVTSLVQLCSLGLHKLYHSDLSLTIRFALRTLWPKWQKKKKSLRKQGH